MANPKTYSFLDVVAALSGPGGSIPLGAGAGVAAEGITITRAADADTMTMGADGDGMHSLNANQSGKVTVRLLKTSPVNAQLNLMWQAQRVSGATHGQNTIVIKNKVSGDEMACQLCAFVGDPEISYAVEGQMIEWEFNSIKIQRGLGAGV